MPLPGLPDVDAIARAGPDKYGPYARGGDDPASRQAGPGESGPHAEGGEHGGEARATVERRPESRLSGNILVRRVVFFTSLLLAWEAVSRYGPWPDYLLPGPITVGTALAAGLGNGLFIKGAVASLLRLVTGYGIALVGGVVLGTVLVRYKSLQETVGTLIVGLQALPSVCWLPLAILWFGLNERAIVFVVVMGSLFSIVLGVQGGIAHTAPTFVKAARNLGASGLSLYTQVVLPSAFPTILSGLKQGWAFASRSMMAAELLYYSLSLGNLLQTGRDLNDAAHVMAVMVLIIAIGVGFNQLLFAPLERRVAERWGFGTAHA